MVLNMWNEYWLEEDDILYCLKSPKEGKHQVLLFKEVDEVEEMFTGMKYLAKQGGVGTKILERMGTKAFSKKNHSITTPHFLSVALVP